MVDPIPDRTYIQVYEETSKWAVDLLGDIKDRFEMGRNNPIVHRTLKNMYLLSSRKFWNAIPKVLNDYGKQIRNSPPPLVPIDAEFRKILKRQPLDVVQMTDI